MRTFVLSVATIAIAATSSGAFAQNIDVATELDDRLRTAGAVSYGKLENRKQRICEIKIEKIRTGALSIPAPVPVKKCRYIDRSVDTRRLAPAEVTSTSVVEVRDFKFHEDRLVELPRNIVVKEFPIYYCIEGTFDNTVGETLTLTRGQTYMKRQSVTTTQAIEVSARVGAPGDFAGASAKASFSTRTMVGTDRGQSNSQAVQKSSRQTIRFSGPQAVMVRIFAYQTTLDVPYSGTAIVDGELAPNNSGLISASQLLSEEERTFPISGLLRIDEASNVHYDVKPIKGGCASPEVQDKVSIAEGEQYATTAALAGLDEHPSASAELSIAEQIMGLRKSATVAPTEQPAYLLVDNEDEPTIGPADGVSYYIASTATELRSDPSCGYSDLGFAKTREWLIEERHYQEASNGQIVRNWVETYETPQGCSSF